MEASSVRNEILESQNHSIVVIFNAEESASFEFKNLDVI
jgi:hypothetical protein